MPCRALPGARLARLVGFSAALHCAGASFAAHAAEPPSSDERPAQPLPALPPPVVQNPDGSVSVHRTPQGGVDVHAATPSGTVRAYDCNRVDLDPNARSANGACPPLPPFVPPPVSFVPPPVYYAPPPYPPYPYAYAPPPKPPSDPARTGALIGASLVFGLGTLASGIAYIGSVTSDERDCRPDGSGYVYCPSRPREPSKPALYTMGGIMTFAPSVPRYVVGDVGMGLLFTGLRGGSFAAGAFIDWDDESYVLPVTFAFVVPLALGVVDLATTPRRKLPAGGDAPHARSFRLDGVGPGAAMSANGALIPTLGASGAF